MKEENNQSNRTILYKMSGYLKIRFLGAIIDLIQKWFKKFSIYFGDGYSNILVLSEIVYFISSRTPLSIQ